MNKYLKTLLGIALVLIPIFVLIRQGALLTIILFGLSFVSFLIGVLLVWSGLSDLKDLIKEKYSKEEDLSDKELDDNFLKNKAEGLGNIQKNE